MEKNFEKKDTNKMKGIAILFLYCYHCFSETKRLMGYDVSFWPLSKSTAMYIFETMNICVGIFAFLSVYGITVSFKRKEASYQLDRESMTQGTVSRYIKLTCSYIFVFMICQIADLFLRNKFSYGETMIEKAGYFLIDLFGLSTLFGTPTLCGTWWYISQAVMIILFMPVILKAYGRYGITFLGAITIFPIYFLQEYDNMTKWLFVIPLGILCADYNVFGRVKQVKITSSHSLSYILKWIPATVILVAFAVVRKSEIRTNGSVLFLIQGLFVAYAIYYCYEFIMDLPIVGSMLELLGKYSMNMFLIHTFLYKYWFSKTVYSFKHCGLILLCLAVVTLLLSMAIEGIKKIIRYDRVADAIIKGIFRNKQKAEF